METNWTTTGHPSRRKQKQAYTVWTLLGLQSSRMTAVHQMVIAALLLVLLAVAINIVVLVATTHHVIEMKDLLPLMDDTLCCHCIVVAMFSRSTEFQLRQWQRENFQSQLSAARRHKNSNIKVQLRFSIAYNNRQQQQEDEDESSVMHEVYREQERYGDLFLVPVLERYEWLTGHLFEMLRLAVNLLNDKGDDQPTECHQNRYIVKTDSDVYVSYDALFAVVASMPSTNTYFGLMQPNNFPTHDFITRRDGSFWYSFFPTWAVGQLYGLTVDVAQRLLQPEVERTVLKRDLGYMFPEEDRSITLALRRSNQTLPLRHLFVKGLYFFCDPEGFSCHAYGDTIAFGVGYGLSGIGEEKTQNKLKLLEEIRKMKETCPRTIDTARQRYFAVDEYDYSPGNTTFRDWLHHGCTSLNPTGRLDLDAYHKRTNSAVFDLATRSRLVAECAESSYLTEYPEVQLHIQLGHYQTGKEHYLAIAHKTKQYHYICPERCINSTDVRACVKCDKEAVYLSNFPDIREAVKQGHVASGKDHYELHGRVEHRSYGCIERYFEPGIGNATGCKYTFERFMNLTEKFVKTWPVIGKDSTVSSKACKALVMAEGRDIAWLDYTLRTHRRYTGPDWMFYLFGPTNVTAEWRKKYGGPMVTIVNLPEEFGDLSVYPTQINNLYRSYFLWNETIQCEHVLVTQTDALLLRHGIEDFFEFAYVGSPVYPESFPTTDWRYLCLKSERCGGNGGLSLRRRSKILRALAECTVPKDAYYEDVWFSYCFVELGMAENLPHPVVANRFSTGTKCLADSPIGVHKLWQNCKESTCISVLINSQLYKDIYGDGDWDHDCREGNINYLMENSDVSRSGFASGWDHYQQHGKNEAPRRWRCFGNASKREKFRAPEPFALPEHFENRNTKGKWLRW